MDAELTGGALGRGGGRLEAKSCHGQNKHQEKPLFLRLQGCVSETRHREGREDEQEPGGCPAYPGEQEGTFDVLVPPLWVVQRTVFLETHIDLEISM